MNKRCVYVFFMLSLLGCTQKLAPDDLWYNARIAYDKKQYGKAVAILERLDLKHGFEPFSLDVLILLAKSYYHRLKQVAFSFNELNAKCCKTCDEVIARDSKKAFINDIMTLRIQSQYHLCLYNFKYADTMFRDTIKLIEDYFEYLNNHYKLKYGKITSITDIRQMVDTITSMEKPPNTPENLELTEIMQIYIKCTKYIIARGLHQASLLHGDFENILAQVEDIINKPEYTELPFSAYKLKLQTFLALQKDILTNTGYPKEMGKEMVHDLVLMLKDIKSQVKTKEDKQTMGELVHMVKQFAYSCGIDEKKITI